MEQNAKSCVVIGSTSVDILCCHRELANAIIDLVVSKGIRHFFNDNQSLFQMVFNTKVSVVKTHCKDKITSTYIMYKKLKPGTKVITNDKWFTQELMRKVNKQPLQKDEFVLPFEFDDCVYLPEQRMHTKNSKTYSAKRIAEIVDYVLVGTQVDKEEHQLTLDWANKLNKPIIKLSDICPEVLTADIKKYRSPYDL